MRPFEVASIEETGRKIIPEMNDIERFKNLREEANRHGWSSTLLESVGANEDRLAQLCAEVGEVRKRARARGALVERLMPVAGKLAHIPSLSAIFGYGEFPAHVDGAHEDRPPRYLVLYCVTDAQRRATRLYRWTEVQGKMRCPALLQRELFYYRTGRRSFADSIASQSRSFIRFDPGCMLPATTRATSVLADVQASLHQVAPFETIWIPGLVLLIDNWSVLHGRGLAEREGERVILRASLD